jgi:hypothetical protein
MNNDENEENTTLKNDLNNQSCKAKEEIIIEINSINNKLTNISSIENINVIKEEINKALNNINNFIEKIIKERDIYESLLRKEENIIRKLYSDLLHEKILKEILEEKILAFMKIQSDFELIKEKTGVIVCDGKIISDGRKDNEINILRKENSTLKNVINKKEEEIKELNNELRKIKNKNNNILFPNYSQRDFTINNFSSTTRNFYKSHKLQTKLLDNKENKTIERNSTSNNINININKISVNTNKFKNNKKISSRNKCSNSLLFNSNNYASSENILNKSKIKTKKIVKKSKIIYPMREFNSVRYINTQSNTNKENINNNEIVNHNNNIKNKNKNGICNNKKENILRNYNNGIKNKFKK